MERQVHSSFQSSDIVCIHCCYWTHPCNSTHLSSNKAVKKQARNHCGPASAYCVPANRALTSRCKSLEDAPLAVPSASDDWEEPDAFPGAGSWVWHVPEASPVLLLIYICQSMKNHSWDHLLTPRPQPSLGAQQCAS